MSKNITQINSHKDDVLSALDSAMHKALMECGEMAVKYAKKNVRNQLNPETKKTGQLMGRIDYVIVDDGDKMEMYVGSNQEYAPYFEFGTGIYYAGGRRTPWVYQDAYGKWHYTKGQRAKPFIKPAIADNEKIYKRIIEANLK